MAEATDGKYFFDVFELDCKKRLLMKEGVQVSLSPKAIDLLAVLVSDNGRTLSKDKLLSAVWKDQFVEENNLSVHISALRKVLGESKSENQFIVTVPGSGYRFVADLIEAPENSTGESDRIQPVQTDQLRGPLAAEKSGISTLKLLMIACVAVFLVIAGVWYFFVWSEEVSSPIESIAIMPFVYDGGNAETEYLSDGITESLINSLSKLPRLKVKARNSVYKYKNKKFDASKIAVELAVQAILVGRIAERGDNYILSVELVDAKTGNHLWGEQYTRKKSGLAVLQRDISKDVSAKLQSKLISGATLSKGQTENAEAYKLYLKGRFLWNKRNQEDHLKAIALFNEAIALDPNFALAYAGLGDVYTVDSFKIDAKERAAKARDVALKALAIEPNLAEGYAILAKLEWNDFNWSDSEKYFKQALALNPNYASARQWYAEFLMRLGRADDSIAEINRAIDLDPFSLIINSDAIYIYLFARQYNNAIIQANKTIELEGNWVRAYEFRGYAYESLGQFPKAIADFEKSVDLGKGSPEDKEKNRTELADAKAAFEKSGAQGYWEKALEIELARLKEDRNNYFVAVLYCNLGDKQKALDSLEKAIEKKERDAELLKATPEFDILRTDPRFLEFLKRINLSG